MTPADLLGLCIYCEARGEPKDGQAAVARVIANRMAAHYESDGTVEGTILRHAQFSWTEYGFAGGGYRRVAWTPEQQSALVQRQLTGAKASCKTAAGWSAFVDLGQAVLAHSYSGGEAYKALGSVAVLYDNLDVAQPPWAIPEKLVTKIGHHSFFRA